MRVIPWYKMYDFVKSKSSDSVVCEGLFSEYLFECVGTHMVLPTVFSENVIGACYEYDTTLTKWSKNAKNTKDLKTFGQIKESMDNYMDSQFRKAGFEVYSP